MMVKRIYIALSLSAGLLASLAVSSVHAHGGQAHVHGTAILQVVVEGSDVEIALQSPLDNLVGFEHAPRTDAQRKAMQAMTDQFQNPLSLFVPNAEAGCTAQPSELHLPFDSEAQGGRDSHSHENHAEMEAVLRFQCANSAALKGVEVLLFGRFPGLHSLDVQVVSPRGQAAARLTPKQPRLQW